MQKARRYTVWRTQTGLIVRWFDGVMVPDHLTIKLSDHQTPGLCSPDIVLRLFVGIWFQVLFHSPPGVLFTFHSRYYTLSVARSI
jgi:hypothetical protein